MSHIKFEQEELDKMRKDAEDLRWIEGQLDAVGADLREAVEYLLGAEERADQRLEDADGIPEWMHCIKKDDAITFCGRHHHGLGWMFVDREHAVGTVMNGDRQMPCPECLVRSEV